MIGCGCDKKFTIYIKNNLHFPVEMQVILSYNNKVGDKGTLDIVNCPFR